MTYCVLLLLLAATALILALLPLILERLQGFLRERFQSFCRNRCKYWVILAFAFGLALGGWLLCCWPDLVLMVRSNPCRLWTLSGMVVLLLLLWQLVRTAGCCGLKGLFQSESHESTRWLGRVSPILAILALLFVLLSQLWRCCGAELRVGMSDWDICEYLLIALLFLLIVSAVFAHLSCAICDHKPHRNCAARMRSLVVSIIAVLLALNWLAYRCCDEFRGDDFDLAMIGIWWEGKHPGEEGVHLRWSFRTDPQYGNALDFPENGFDIQRRPAGSGSWTTLNAGRIFPATVWGDETAGPTGQMWLAEAVERIHPDDFDQFRGQPFDDLVEMVAQDSYSPLYYVETPDPTVFATAPSNPYASEAGRQAYLDSYYNAPGGDEFPPLMTWEIEPMGTLMTTAMFSEIARLLGLFYIDKTADPAIAYDYRVVGYWNDRTRRYTVPAINQPNTAPLVPPQISDIHSPVEVGEVDGEPVYDDRVVALNWDPPRSQNPPVSSGLLDIIEPVLFTVEHFPLWTVPDEGWPEGQTFEPCTVPSDISAFEPARRHSQIANAQDVDTGDSTDDSNAVLPPVLVSPLEDELTLDLHWPEYFFYHRNLPYGCHAYRVVGMDVFGRSADPSDPKVRRVDDLTPPPTATLVTASIVQREDPALHDVQRDALFPSGSTHDYSFTISWVWPQELVARAPDTSYFEIYGNLTDFEPFPGEGPTQDPPRWKNDSSWDVKVLLGPEPLTGALPLPSRYQNLGYIEAGSLYFERSFTEEDLDAAGITLEQLGLEPGDYKPVDHAYFGVAAVDRYPYENRGDISAPVLAVARDLVPPQAPDPAPTLHSGPFDADKQGNRSFTMSWTGQDLYTYALYRAPADAIEIEDGILAADLPACFNASPPVRTLEMDDEEWARAQRHFAVRRTFAKNLDSLWENGAFARISPLLIKPSISIDPLEASPPRTPATSSVSYTDKADATVSSEWIFVASTYDIAGNESGPSCPSPVVLVEDGVPPRIPVIRAIDGGDNGITIRWVANDEVDLAYYNVYRTDDETSTDSRRKMNWIAGLNPAGVDDIASPDHPESGNATLAGTVPYVTMSLFDGTVEAGKPYFYRLEAVDLAGNRSALSSTARNQAFDTTPPVALAWGIPAFDLSPAGANHHAANLHWIIPPDDAALKTLVQVREVGTGFWRPASGWLNPGVSSFQLTLTGTSGDGFEFRLRAMDGQGNRGDWSAIVTIALP